MWRLQLKRISPDASVRSVLRSTLDPPPRALVTDARRRLAAQKLVALHDDDDEQLDDELRDELRDELHGTAMKKLRIVRLGFGAARQKRVLERWTNPKPLQPIWDRAAI